MGLPDFVASPPAFREVEKGPTFEVYQGPLCVNRMDWTRQGVVRTIIVGHAGLENAEALIRRFEAVLRFTGRTTGLYDVWGMTGYDTAFRVALTTWGTKNRGVIDTLHATTGSKIVNMGLTVASMALGGLFTVHSKRIDFDRVAKDLGLPLNPPMPALRPSFP